MNCDDVGGVAVASNTWITDHEHSRQFKADFVKISALNTLSRIEHDLRSGMVKGIGFVYVGRLLKAFGMVVFDVIEQALEKLREVEEINLRRASWTN